MIANAEAGILIIRATSRQHDKIQEFLDQVLSSAKRQVLIEACPEVVSLSVDIRDMDPVAYKKRLK